MSGVAARPPMPSRRWPGSELPTRSCRWVRRFLQAELAGYRASGPSGTRRRQYSSPGCLSRTLERWAPRHPERGVRSPSKIKDLDPLTPAFTITYANFLVRTNRLDQAAAVTEGDSGTRRRGGGLFRAGGVRRAQQRFGEAIRRSAPGQQLVGLELPEDVLKSRAMPRVQAMERAAQATARKAEQQVQASSYVSPWIWPGCAARREERALAPTGAVAECHGAGVPERRPRLGRGARRSAVPGMGQKCRPAGGPAVAVCRQSGCATLWDSFLEDL